MTERIFDFVVTQLTAEKSEDIGFQINSAHFENTFFVQAAGVEFKENGQHAESEAAGGTINIVAVFAKVNVGIETADKAVDGFGRENTGARAGGEAVLRCQHAPVKQPHADAVQQFRLGTGHSAGRYQ